VTYGQAACSLLVAIMKEWLEHACYHPWKVDQWLPENPSLRVSIDSMRSRDPLDSTSLSMWSVVCTRVGLYRLAGCISHVDLQPCGSVNLITRVTLLVSSMVFHTIDTSVSFQENKKHNNLKLYFKYFIIDYSLLPLYIYKALIIIL